MKFKKMLFGFLAVSLLLVGCGGKKEAPADAQEKKEEVAKVEESKTNYHIGIVTPTVSQSEDSLRGAESVMKEYGSVKDGGKIIHITNPDNFMQEQETTISQIVSLADDPEMRAIIVGEGIPGTYSAFKAIREKRPEILLMVSNPHEDPDLMSSAADLIVNPDSVARGYLIIKAAKDLGADKFMHISFPRHLSYELIARRRAIMKETAKDLGMEYIEMSAPDPVSDVGVPGAQQFILEQVPNWIEKYGKNVAFFATNDAQTEPLLKQIAAHGGYFIEADLPSPTMGYPGALGIKFDDSEKGNWPKILDKVEKSVLKAGGKDRMGTWAYSYNFATVEALVDVAMKNIENQTPVDDFKNLLASYQKFTPGAGWNGKRYTDADGVEKDNFFLLYQDTYVFGKGYLHMNEVEIPEKYFKIKK
ncbi:MAG: hypothetical protein CR959_00770 [Fusobacteriales bacterium]|nr:MAG: hypothetical protein CR959_00770 [Fusobacteriales bacterium]